MKKTIFSIMMALVVLTCLGLEYHNEVKADKQIETQTIKTTITKDSYADDFVGSPYMAEMYVTSVDYPQGLYNRVHLIDNDGNEWIYDDIDLYEDDEVIVLMTDNNTTDDVTDDYIVKFFVGIE